MSVALLPDNIILHIGAAKTGSTALQNTFDAQYDNLLAQGVLFPRSILRRSNLADQTRTPGHLDLLEKLSPDVPSPLFSELEQHAGQVDRLMLSIENLFHYKDKADLNRLVELLKGKKIHMIAVLRDQITWLESFYYETVVGGIRNEVKPPSDLVKTMLEDGILTYESRLEYLQKLLDAETLTVLPYRDAHSDLNLLERFTKATGIDLPQSATLGAVRANTSQRFGECVEAHRRFNPLVTHLERQERQSFSEIMKIHYLQMNEAGILTKNARCLAPVVRQHIKAACTFENKQLQQRLPKNQSLGLEDTYAEPSARLKESVIADVFDCGIEVLSSFAEKVPALDRLHQLTPMVNNSGVIMIFSWDISLTLAAAKAGKFIMSIQPNLSKRLLLQSFYDKNQLPGAVVVLDVAPDQADLGEIWNKSWFREPDLVLLGADEIDQLARLACVLRKPATVVIEGTGTPDPIVLSELNIRAITRTGRFSYFQLPVPG
ncbi:hypothetical protein OS189_18510 [Sulfitobacter sp. F26169L]|uniref:hypothetical protein n=1 Tax=Sulfitobacter sp. F26169L TaxID=2996015 RepID=UPI002260F73F|nr:hypothetical protein [Sulfitobacter sp. F26169L]MCX7568334.1 hypothetical protein [Sulfitobacter sp. F26169L]